MTSPTWVPTGIPNLVQHAGNSRYYARYSCAGRKTFRALGTAKLAVAKQKLREMMGDVDKARAEAAATDVAPEAVRMGQLVREFLAASAKDTNLSAGTKATHVTYCRRLQTTWRGFDAMRPASVTVAATRDWITHAHTEAEHSAPGAKTVRVGYSASSLNHSLGVLAMLLDAAVAKGAIFTNPLTLERVRELRRRNVARVPELPAKADMDAMFAAMLVTPVLAPRYHTIQDFLAAQARDASELARFLAYSGGRLNEVAEQVWEDIGADSIVLRGTKTDSSRYRVVPIISAMRSLIDEMKKRRVGQKLTGRVFAIRECDKSLRRACAAAGVKRLRHHDLRHYFATACIESGVDIPTVSRWLGHADGGALAMRTYGHLRQEHSIAAGAKVVA